MTATQPSGRRDSRASFSIKRPGFVPLPDPDSSARAASDREASVGPPAASSAASGWNISGSLEGFAELTLQTPDPAKLAEFYCAAFGCEVLTREPDRVWLAVGGRARLGLWTPGEKEFGDRGGRHVHFVLRVSRGRLDSLSTYLRDQVVELDGPVEHDGGDRSLYFRDPEGNVVELWDFFHRDQGRAEGVRALAEPGG